MIDDTVNPEMRWTVTTEFMRQAAEDSEKRRELEAAVERAERILAALREPSKKILSVIVTAVWIKRMTIVENRVADLMIRAAVAAAEQEVGRE